MRSEFKHKMIFFPVFKPLESFMYSLCNLFSSMGLKNMRQSPPPSQIPPLQNAS